MIDYRKPYIISIIDRTKQLDLTDDGIGVPAIAIKCAFVNFREGDAKEKRSLSYFDIGCQHVHLFQGKVVKDMPNGIVFRAKERNYDIWLTELTMEQFDTRIRRVLPAEVSEMLNDLDDVYVWYRQMVGIS